MENGLLTRGIVQVFSLTGSSSDGEPLRQDPITDVQWMWARGPWLCFKFQLFYIPEKERGA